MTPNRDQADLIERLKAAAAKATPEDRRVEDKTGVYAGMYKIAECACDHDLHHAKAAANAAFIALCSPENVLSLIDRLASLQSELDEARGALTAIAHTLTEDSHGNMKTMPATYYQRVATDTLDRLDRASLTRTAGGEDAA